MFVNLLTRFYEDAGFRGARIEGGARDTIAGTAPVESAYFFAFRSAIAVSSLASASFLQADFSAPLSFLQAAFAIFSSASICFFAALYCAWVIFPVVVVVVVVAAGMVVAAGAVVVLCTVVVLAVAGAVWPVAKAAPETSNNVALASFNIDFMGISE